MSSRSKMFASHAPSTLARSAAHDAAMSCELNFCFGIAIRSLVYPRRSARVMRAVCTPAAPFVVEERTSEPYEMAPPQPGDIYALYTRHLTFSGSSVRGAPSSWR